MLSDPCIHNNPLNLVTRMSLAIDTVNSSKYTMNFYIKPFFKNMKKLSKTKMCLRWRLVYP